MNPRAIPAITSFIGVNALVFLVMIGQALFHGSGLRSFDNPLIDRRNIGWDLLLSSGHMSEYGQWWRAVTSSFVHLDASHLIFNLLALLFIGQAVERTLGSAVTVWAMIGAIGWGSITCLIMQPNAMMGGASTVVYGLMAALVGIKLAAREQLVSVAVMVAIYFAWSMFTPGVSLWGHVGGFIGGSVGYLAAGGLRPALGLRAVLGDHQHTAISPATKAGVAGVLSIIVAAAVGVL